MDKEKEVKLFHCVLSVIDEGELIAIQARLPENRDGLRMLWEQQNHFTEMLPEPVLGFRMKELFNTRTTLKREPFCDILGMKPQNWHGLINGWHRTTKRDHIWRFAVLLGLDMWETCNLLRLDNELDMKKWDERDRIIWKCLKEGGCTPAKVEEALHREKQKALYDAEAHELLDDPEKWAAAQKKRKRESV